MVLCMSIGGAFNVVINEGAWTDWECEVEVYYCIHRYVGIGIGICTLHQGGSRQDSALSDHIRKNSSLERLTS